MLNLSKLYKRIVTFNTLGHENKRLIVEAVIYSAVARATILLIPFRIYNRYFGNSNKETTFKIEKENYEIIRKVEWAVKVVCSHTPWQSKCLVQALTAQRMLKKSNMPTTLYLGVNKNGDNSLSAHAWLRCGHVYVTGGDYRNEYIQVAKFAK